MNCCTTANQIASQDQKLFLFVHIKNKLNGSVVKLINSRNSSSWNKIKLFSDTHFGDSRLELRHTKVSAIEITNK